MGVELLTKKNVDKVQLNGLQKKCMDFMTLIRTDEES